MTTYLARSALARLEEAQQQIDRHVVRGRDGRCPRCGETEPCSRRNAASAVFARYDCLPRRRPGLAGSRTR
ncbi:MAG: hypothetical protein V7603_4591 [Micromonosporaceae bacterium]|jgi:hypothetical protein